MVMLTSSVAGSAITSSVNTVETNSRKTVTLGLGGAATRLGNNRLPLKHAEVGRLQCKRHRASATAQRTTGPAIAAASASLRELHPVGKAIETGNLKVSDVHMIHYQIYGNPQGQPALVVHGGPGAGCYANHARFFDPRHWKVVLVDQRGCGASRPLGCLQNNTTQALIDDYEQLRKKLKIKNWLLFGGSWGVTLSLAYAQQHPDVVSGIVLRGVCLMRPSEIGWMFGGGVGHLQPRGWRQFEGHVAADEKSDLVAAYHKRLTSADTAVRGAAAASWLSWEHAVGSSRTSSLQFWNGSQWQQSDFPSPDKLRRSLPLATTSTPPTQGAAAAAAAAPHKQATGSASPSNGAGARTGSAQDAAQPASMSTFTAQAVLECHYSHNGAFLQQPLLQGIDRVRHIPCIAVQGRLDYVCPVVTAYDLHCEWPEMELRVVPNAGHSMYDDGIKHELLDATDRMRKLPPKKTKSVTRSTLPARSVKPTGLNLRLACASSVCAQKPPRAA